jgi:hypothetical protein
LDVYPSRSGVIEFCVAKLTVVLKFDGRLAIGAAGKRSAIEGAAGKAACNAALPLAVCHCATAVLY